MSRRRNQPKGKKINPHYWVFCEGETEEAYIKHLRSKYRLPIEIISKVSGHEIDEKYINRHKKGKLTHSKDKDFLIYDSDIPEVLEKLKKIESTHLIASNPSIELWFLLHYKNCRGHISEADCIRELENRNRSVYKKGSLDKALKSRLDEKRQDACKRAKNLNLYENPSSNMFEFIEELEKWKNN